MVETIETAVIGAGQAGLAASYHLTQRGREHVVLERGRAAETWRSCRWDGFYLNTPNWSLQLPGHEYDGPEPDAFAPLPEVIEYLERYAGSTGADVVEGATVTCLEREAAGGYLVHVNGEPGYRARNVVVATGAYQRPRSRPGAPASSEAFQLTTSEYRRPDQLPDGAVLVVGSGQSGCQISDELLDAGRTVYLSTGRCPWFPRRYRGREIVRWAIDVGLMDQTVDTLPSPEAKLACNPPVSGNGGGHDCNPRWLARKGVFLVGRVQGFDGNRVVLADDVAANLLAGDEFVRDLLGKLDAHAAATGQDVAAPDPPELGGVDDAIRTELDLRADGVSTVLWASGYRPDYSWIQLPVTDARGWPVQTRGVSEYRGLYFVGVHWLHKRKSSLLFGVGEDAEFVATHLDATR